MKIRIDNDSIRLRLDRIEVDRIGAMQNVECRTRFPGGAAFVYRLTVGASRTGATFTDDCIEVALAAATARHWAQTETEISIHEELGLSDGALKLLIEKDFECLDPRPGENQTNRFRNPKAS